MPSNFKNLFKYFFTLLILFGAIQAFASTGTIIYGANPLPTPNKQTALLCTNSACTTSTRINFFTTQGATVNITDASVTGDIWGERVGWIRLNPGGGYGGVTNTTAGVLGGYAWGENTGWINFNSKANCDTDDNGFLDINDACGGDNSTTTYADFGVTINSLGEFDGWAWAQNYGWIKFDCSVTDACVETDWRPLGTAQCSDVIDNDSDGLIDYPDDPGCTSVSDDDETDTTTSGGGTTPTFCELHPNDPSCVTPTFCELHPTDSSCVTPTFCELHPTDSSCITPTFCELHPTDSSCITLTFCELNPSDPSCTTPTFCELNPSDPSCIPSPTCEELGNCPIVLPPIIEEIVNAVGDAINNAIGDIVGNIGSGISQGFNSAFNSLPPTVQKDLEAAAQTVKKVNKAIVKVVDSPAGDTTIKIVTSTGVVTGVTISLFSTLFMSPLSFSELFLIPIRLWGLLMAAFGIKRRNKPWGTVYDSVTKQPLDPAYVIVQDLQGNEVATSITDLDGRYGFLIPPGRYRLLAHKTNYEFPSIKLAGKKIDEIYTDLYFDDIIEITNDSSVITKNIPMDPLKFDWNEFTKKDQNLMRFYSKRDIWVTRVSDIMFYLGFAITAIVVLATPKIYNVATFTMYVILYALKHTILKPRPNGTITEKETGRPLSFAILHVYSSDMSREIVSKVADKTGKFYCLIPNGTYSIKIEKKNLDESYKEVYREQGIEVKSGFINTKFEIENKPENFVPPIVPTITSPTPPIQPVVPPPTPTTEPIPESLPVQIPETPLAQIPANEPEISPEPVPQNPPENLIPPAIQ